MSDDNIIATHSTRLSIMRSRLYQWKPQADITAHELALCIGPLLTSDIHAIETLPDNARRHFVEVRP